MRNWSAIACVNSYVTGRQIAWLASWKYFMAQSGAQRERYDANADVKLGRHARDYDTGVALFITLITLRTRSASTSPSLISALEGTRASTSTIAIALRNAMSA